MGFLLMAGGGLHAKLAVGAVLLAAGAGSRLAARPKSLLELGGVPLILRQLIALSGAGVDEIVVVLGHHAALIEPVLRSFPVALVFNPAPDQGQSSSLLTGLRALNARMDAVIVALADQPMIDAEDIGTLIAAFKGRQGADMVVPRFEGLPGNPVIFSSALRDEWLAGNSQAAGRAWRDANPDRVRWLDTDNQRYRVDIDTPEDIALFAQRTGHTLKWPAALERSATPPIDSIG